jgi:hypothetical protein
MRLLDAVWTGSAASFAPAEILRVNQQNSPNIAHPAGQSAGLAEYGISYRSAGEDQPLTDYAYSACASGC